jgi:nucleotide-binding universal stress UspA family protein
MAGDIVLGYDGLEGATSALRAATRIARAFDAPLTIVFGYEPNPMGGQTADYHRRLEEIGHDAVTRATAEALEIDPAVQVETEVIDLRPVEALLAVAAAREARVIVVGGTGERPLMGAVLGSVPHKLLHRSPVPVLVVPATDAD